VKELGLGTVARVVFCMFRTVHEASRGRHDHSFDGGR
jgi:hypothetical protein